MFKRIGPIEVGSRRTITITKVPAPPVGFKALTTADMISNEITVPTVKVNRVFGVGRTFSYINTLT